MRLGPDQAGALRGGVAFDEGERDRRVHLGEDCRGAGPERFEQAAELVGELHAGGHQVVAAAHQRAQRADLVALRGERLEAVAVGAQQVGEQVGVGGVALGAVAAVARASGLDGVGVDGHDGEACFDQRIDDESGGPFDRNRRALPVAQATLQLGQTGGIVGDVEALAHAALAVDHAHRVGAAGPVQPGEECAHGQTPASCGMTCRAGSPRGSLTDWRSWLRTLALHPVARLGLPAPRGLRVSHGPSSGQRTGQSPRGHGSRNTPSARQSRRVKIAARRGRSAGHGLPTGCFAVVDNAPRGVRGASRVVHNHARWTTLRRDLSASSTTSRVVQ